MRPIIVALDVSTQQQALALVDQLANENDLMVKVGMELFYAVGPTIVTALRQRGVAIFKAKIFIPTMTSHMVNTIRSWNSSPSVLVSQAHQMPPKI